MAGSALVTGGAGFIGSHLVERLLCAGWTVRVLDNFSTGSPENLRRVSRDIEIATADVRDGSACAASCRGVDAVFHLAAIASVASSVEDPALTHDVTLGGTLNMLLAARDAGVRRFVYTSSAAVYGNAGSVPTPESQPILPLSPYATAKAAGEMYCRNFHGLYGLETVSLRYFNVFGPRQSANSGYAAAIPRFVHAALRDENPTVFGDGRQTRDFVFVEDVARANILAAGATEAPGMAFNVAGGAEISLLDLLSALRDVTGARLAPDFKPQRPGDVRRSRASIELARSVLDYSPAVSVTEGIRRTVEAAR